MPELAVLTENRVNSDPVVSFSSSSSAELLGITQKNDSTVPREERDDKRKEVREHVEREGVILPSDNFFYQFIDRVTKRVGIPIDTELIVIDSERFNAALAVESNIILTSRGMGRALLEGLEKKGKIISEDHIAAVEAHEVAHAKIHGGKENRKPGHAEEYRADAESMETLARAGYNPKAIVEVFEAMPLVLGRDDPAHPEIIDRIRKLEDRLANDEHPLPNTSKPFTPLPGDVQRYFQEDSEIYTTTDSMLAETPKELRERLLSATTQKEFSDTLQVLKHVDRLAEAKGMVQEHGRELDVLMQKIMVFQTLGSSWQFHNGHAVIADSDIRRNPYNRARERMARWLTRTSGLTDVVTPSGFFTAQAAQPYRDSVPAKSNTSAYRVREINRVSGYVDEAIQKFVETLEDDKQRGWTVVPLETQEVIDQTLVAYRSGTITDDMYLSVFRSVDEKTYQESVQRMREQRAEKGRRAEDESNIKRINLRDPMAQDALIQQMKLAVAMDVVGGATVVHEHEVIDAYAQLLAGATHLPIEANYILAKTILQRSDINIWAEYLKNVDRESLPQYSEGVQNIDFTLSSPFISPLRPFHQAFAISSNNESRYEVGQPGSVSYEYKDMLYFDSPGGEHVIKAWPSAELLRRGIKPDQARRPGGAALLPPQAYDLTLTEWKMVGGSGQDDYAIWQYAQRLKNNEQIDPELYQAVQEIKPHHWNNGILTPADLQIVMDHTVWDESTTREIIASGLYWFPKSSQDKAEREAVYQAFEKAYPFFLSDSNEAWRVPTQTLTKEQIVSMMLDIRSLDLQADGLPTNEAVRQALFGTYDRGYEINYDALSDRFKTELATFTDQDLEILLGHFSVQPAKNEQETIFRENLQLIATVPQDRRVLATQRVYCSETLKSIIEVHGPKAAGWITQTFEPSVRRDVLLVSLLDFSGDQLRLQLLPDVAQNLFASPDEKGSGFNPSRSPYFKFGRYKAWTGDEDNDITVVKKRFRGEGELAKRFDNILTRRNSFATLGINAESAFKHIWNPAFDMGSPYQRLLARRITEVEPMLLDDQIALKERTSKLQEVATFPSVVRDIHLEIMLEIALVNAKTDQEKIDAGNQLLPLFTEKSNLKMPLATEVLRAELREHPDVLSDFDRGLQRVIQYLPNASLARNYFLSLLENSANVTPDQIRTLLSLRISPEGKRTEDDDAPWVFIANRLGEMDRPERIKTALWLLGIGIEKPHGINRIEQEFDGHLDSLPNVIAAQTPDEQEILFKRLFLGAEGIVDLEAVPKQYMEEAEAYRRDFTELLAVSILPDTMPQAPLFRDLFSTIITSSDAAHASQILIKIISKVTEAKVAGRELAPEEIVALGLTELGVIGKKVSQSLGEMDWVPSSYKRAFNKAQTEGASVPKRALLTLAEDAGFIDGSAGIRILSFNQLLGAASNKQACDVTTEILDDSHQLPPGVHELVGKFKRPSAQKVDNIRHDLGVLTDIIAVLKRSSTGTALPPDFAEKIESAVLKELDFEGEKVFNETLRLGLVRRNLKRDMQIDIPTIVDAKPDAMLETKAEGITLRKYYDMLEGIENGKIQKEYGHISRQRIDQALFAEGTAEIVISGDFHGDLHPGNILIKKNGDITVIDLGMHGNLSREERLRTVSLLFGLMSGNEGYVKSQLKKFGWRADAIDLALSGKSFAENIQKLVNASHKGSLPEQLNTIILAASKLTTYAHDIDKVALAKFLLQTIDSRDLPRILLSMPRGLFPEKVSGVS